MSATIAAVYDVHGNLPALDAVLDAADAAGAETIVFGGDVALGPMPRETLERLLALGARAHCIRGNCDRLVVDAYDDRPLPSLPGGGEEAIVWTARQLDREHRDFLASWPPSLALDVPGMGEVLFCHGSPRSDDEIITARTPPARLRAMLESVRQRVVVCGHTHMQFDRTLDGVRVLNAGSVGMPFGRPGAYWLLLGPDARLQRTEYDFERTAALVRGTSHPSAEEFASRHILNPHAEEEMLALFERSSASE
jgi:putative phosphoesterase